MITFLLCKLLASAHITGNISGRGDVTFKAPLGKVLYVSGQNNYQGNTTIVGEVIISSPQNLPPNGTIFLGDSPSVEPPSHLLLTAEKTAGTLTVESNLTLPNIMSHHPESAIKTNNYSEINIQGSITGAGISFQGNGSYTLAVTSLTTPLYADADITLK
jgi:hypothetical protein